MEYKTIEHALSESTGFVNMNGMHGYLSFSAANYLVGTGEYVFQHVSCWGYVVKKKLEAVK